MEMNFYGSCVVHLKSAEWEDFLREGVKESILETVVNLASLWAYPSKEFPGLGAS